MSARFCALSTASLPQSAADVELERSSSPALLGEIEWLPAVLWARRAIRNSEPARRIASTSPGRLPRSHAWGDLE